ncbi:MAG: molecular chaperone [Lachnospiraceae bacterium]|jgi:hypothetical protein|nr:molecular chaperone [Lachnospiraceae bacterium]
MDNNLNAEQKEALEVYIEYNKKLMNSINMLLSELREQRKDDTDEFQKKIIEGLNWEIQILNGTLSLINQKEERINKNEVNQQVLKLGEALKTGEDKEIADSFEKDILPEFTKVEEIIQTVLNEQKGEA